MGKVNPIPFPPATVRRHLTAQRAQRARPSGISAASKGYRSVAADLGCAVGNGLLPTRISGQTSLNRNGIQDQQAVLLQLDQGPLEDRQ